MRTTVILDDALISEAKRIAGETKTSHVINKALEEYVERENRLWLAKMGGTMPNLTQPPRRKF